MTQSETTRVVTFEVDHHEAVAILAGTSEADKRTIYRGQLDGRYAVVPVDELNAEEIRQEVPEGSDVAIQNMRLVGKTVVLPDDGGTNVSLRYGGRQTHRMDRKGVYGLLWVPFE